MVALLAALVGSLLVAEPMPPSVATPSTNALPSTGMTNDVVEREFQSILARDDAAQAAAASLITAEDQSKDPLEAPFRVTLRARLDQKFQPVRDAYVDFLLQHPNHARGHLAFGSFLLDLGDEAEALVQDEKARDLDPSNPAVWNNLGGLYARLGRIPEALTSYEEARRLNPSEAAYAHSLGTLICLFPREAAAHLHCEEGQVLTRAVAHYQTALRLDPENFEYAQDLAETFYGRRPPVPETAEARLALGQQALGAWTNALERANLNIQREGVYLHMARWHLRLKAEKSALECLQRVTNNALLDLRRELQAQINPPASGNTNTLPSPLRAQ